MRIGVNTLFLIPGEVGGSETYLRDVLRHAVPRFPDITWVLFTNAENEATLRGDLGASPRVVFECLNVRARRRAARIVAEQTRLPARVRRAGVDGLWSPGYTAPLWPGCPQVVSVLDMQYCEFPQDLSRPAWWATRLLVPAAVRRSRAVLTLSRFSRAQIVRYTGVPEDRVTVAYPGVDAVFGRPLPARERAERVVRLVPSARYILCVANTYPHKNVAALVDAFGEAERATDRALVLVGMEGRGEAAVQEAVRRRGLAARLIRLRRLSREDLVALYQGADVFVFPSLYEGFGLPVLEAMYAGVPVIAADKGAIPEVGGKNVFYFDGTADHLVERWREVAALSVERLGEITAAANRAAASFTWERAADETVACLVNAIRLAGASR